MRPVAGAPPGAALTFILHLMLGGTVLWLVLLFAAPAGRLGPLTAVVYELAGVLCHQQAARSFHVDGRPLPVCARCTGLYTGAALGAVIAPLTATRLRRLDVRAWRRLIVAAAAPTVLSVALAWLGGPSASDTIRAVAAIPLGLSVAALVAAVARGYLR